MDAFAPEIKLLSQSFCAVESRPSSSPPLGPIPLGPRGEERKVLSLQTTRRRRQRASSKSRAKCEKRGGKEGCKRARQEEEKCRSTRLKNQRKEGWQGKSNLFWLSEVGGWTWTSDRPACWAMGLPTLNILCPLDKEKLRQIPFLSRLLASKSAERNESEALPTLFCRPSSSSSSCGNRPKMD